MDAKCDSKTRRVEECPTCDGPCDITMGAPDPEPEATENLNTPIYRSVSKQREREAAIATAGQAQHLAIMAEIRDKGFKWGDIMQWIDKRFGSGNLSAASDERANEGKGE